MNITIFIDNLVLEGIHGVTKKEKGVAQPFRVDIEALCDLPSDMRDDIARTADYRLMKRAAETVIREESHALLETIAARIALKLKEDARVITVRVTLRKLAIWANGIPGVQIEL